MSKQKGIDISKWQESVNFAKVKADGIQFAILREGYRKAIDDRFLEYVQGCQKNGIPVPGVYHFLYSLTKDDALAEAKSCITNVKKAGLGKDTIIFADFEYDTVKKAKAAGVTLKKKDCIEHTKAFCEYVESQGYKAGIYSNIDYYRNMYDKSLIDKYVFWLADYTGDPDYTCAYQQYSSSGKVAGINGNVDMDYYFGTVKTETKKTGGETVGVTAQDAINVMAGWVGKSRSAGTHHDIIDLYNSHKPLARGYAVTYSDAYCDTTISAVFIKLNAVDIIGGTECGVEAHVALFKAAGIWEEDGRVTPQPGWLIVYNWDDATQPNDGYSDHIGMVEKVSGGYITCIEGNMNGGVVGRRTIPVGWGYIRGYAKPKYATSGKTSTTEQKTDSGKTATQTTTGTTLSKAKKWNGIIVDKTGANIRTWAGTENHQVSFSPLKYGTVIEVCDTIKAADNTDWYYIRYNGKYGFVSAALVQRKETAASEPFTPVDQVTKKTATYGAEVGPDKSVAGTYKVTADSLNIRNRAGVDTARGCTILGAIPEGTKVQNYGFYSVVGGVKWLYVQVTHDGVTYTGHCSGEYLKKV